MKNDNFCALPFHHMVIKTNGNYNVCCQHKIPKDEILKNIKTSEYSEWFYGKYLTDLRKDFLSGKKPEGCKNCWIREDNNLSSIRQRTKKEYMLLGINVDKPQIKNIEIDLGNLCNLKCLMCDEHSSSAILSENKKLKINKINQSELKWDTRHFQNLRKILEERPTVINIRGGEPFYNKHLLKILKNIPDDQAKTTMIHITTNGTIYSKEWIDVLAKFKIIRMMFSVDATDELYEYIRFPASWNQVENNIHNYMKLPNVRGLIHAVVQNLNIKNLVDLILWSMKHNYYLELETLEFPNYLSFHNLKDNDKKIAIEKLESFLEENKTSENLILEIKTIIKILKESHFDQSLWNLFESNVKIRDDLRGNSYKKFLSP